VGTAHRTNRVRIARWLPPITAIVTVATVLVLTTPGMALADTDDIIVVLDNLRLVIVVLAGAAVAVMLTLGGLRYLLASDPGETEKAKSALRAAAIGFGIILLAIPFVEILQGILTYE
jgi:hypothetical protein